MDMNIGWLYFICQGLKWKTGWILWKGRQILFTLFICVDLYN
jgi:hypothetical protein